MVEMGTTSIGIPKIITYFQWVNGYNSYKTSLNIYIHNFYLKRYVVPNNFSNCILPIIAKSMSPPMGFPIYGRTLGRKKAINFC